MKRLFPVLFVALVLVRVPSLAQPAGGDQGLYAYVGQAIARGEVPYRDAWDQKPPAIHAAYAAMYALWPHDSIVPAADLLAAVGIALLLVPIGRRLTGARGPGELAALLYLLLANPSFQRLDGLYVRAQCETFIALLLCGALLLITHGVTRESDDRRRPIALLGAGVLLGLAFLFKYNAAIYFLAGAGTVGLLLSSRLDRPGGARVAPLALLGAGFAVPVALAVLWFVRAGAVTDLFHATVTYNLKYSGETYGGAWGMISYLLTFPVRHALRENDSLWLLGGLSCVVLLGAASRDRIHLALPIWVAAACLSIAINSGRNLPQYFVQAQPVLALAAGLATVLAWRALSTAPRLVLVALLAVAVWRVSPFEKAIAQTAFDLRYLRGGVPRAEYLARFSSDRYSAVALGQVADYVKEHTLPNERILVFGFSGGAYVRAGRISASRFFWSRPILVGFNEGMPGYGAAGLLEELTSRRPAIVVLQQHDWPAERIDSATYFMRHPRLGPWLQAGYELASRNDMYQVWRKRTGA